MSHRGHFTRLQKPGSAMSPKKSFAAFAMVAVSITLVAACSSSKNGANFDQTEDAGSTVDASDDLMSIVPDASNQESSILDGGGVLNDAKLDVDASSCVPDAGSPGPGQRRCISFG